MAVAALETISLSHILSHLRHNRQRAFSTTRSKFLFSNFLQAVEETSTKHRQEKQNKPRKNKKNQGHGNHDETRPECLLLAHAA